jgi:hypothetical protein
MIEHPAKHLRPKNLLKEHSTHLIDAIELCIKNGFFGPALMLIYSTINVMAWLNRAEGHEDVVRNDFLLWVDTFLLPESRISFNALDLYAARCAILHSYSAESKLSRHGKAIKIGHAWLGKANQYDVELIKKDASTGTKLLPKGMAAAWAAPVVPIMRASRARMARVTRNRFMEWLLQDRGGVKEKGRTTEPCALNEQVYYAVIYWWSPAYHKEMGSHKRQA